jgi:glycosyltransferase involved in cell wall biosynthesis
MKLAVIDHVGNPGGGSRVTRALLIALKKVRPDWEITFFGNPHSIKRENLERDISPHNIRIRSLSSTRLNGRDLFNIRGSRHVIHLFQRKFHRPLSLFPHAVSGAIEKELEARVKGFDAALFTWPFHLKCPYLQCPTFGIFHDFCFKYFFCTQTMPPWNLDFLNRETPIWLSKTVPIVSTEFMKSELQKFYPDFGHKVQVVPVAPTSAIPKTSIEESRDKIRVKFKISGDYILCPTNISSHKNSGALLAAFPLLKYKGHALSLVFVGSGTERIHGRACAIGLEVGAQPQDVYGLGYVTSEEIDMLIQCACIVVNPSFYEGGNVPGFDAWLIGVPVAMSNIPTFREHIQTHNVRAALFEPRSPEDIAAKLHAILENPAQTKGDVEHSQKAITQFTWERTAEGYARICEKTRL